MTRGQLQEVTLYTMRELTRIYGRLPAAKEAVKEEADEQENAQTEPIQETSDEA
jgi:hypothetical protein